MHTIEEIARLAIKTLDLQQKFFKSRDQTDLQIAKDYERRLRKACEEALKPPTPNLFDDSV